jgi:hypothetical protein
MMRVLLMVTTSVLNPMLGVYDVSRLNSVETATATCRPADTVIVPERLEYLKDFISSADPVYQASRDSVGLAKQAASKVKLVTNAATCQIGINALNGLLQTPGAAREIWLFALGSGYAIHSPGIPSTAGEPDPLFFFDNQFNYLSTLMVQ